MDGWTIQNTSWWVWSWSVSFWLGMKEKVGRKQRRQFNTTSKLCVCGKICHGCTIYQARMGVSPPIVASYYKNTAADIQTSVRLLMVDLLGSYRSPVTLQPTSCDLTLSWLQKSRSRLSCWTWQSTERNHWMKPLKGLLGIYIIYNLYKNPMLTHRTESEKTQNTLLKLLSLSPRP